MPSHHSSFMISIAAVLLLTSSCGTPKTASERARTADDYLMLGVNYKKSGRIEKSREALETAIKEGADSKTAHTARRFLKQQLPRSPVPIEAEQRNVIGFNQMRNGDKEMAIQTFSNLIKDFPEFEWPYCNLAAIYMKDKKLNEAEKLLERALEINPSYMNGWLYLRQVKLLKKDTEGASNCSKRIAALEAYDGSSELTTPPDARDSHDSKS